MIRHMRLIIKSGVGLDVQAVYYVYKVIIQSLCNWIRIFNYHVVLLSVMYPLGPLGGLLYECIPERIRGSKFQKSFPAAFMHN